MNENSLVHCHSLNHIISYTTIIITYRMLLALVVCASSAPNAHTKQLDDPTTTTSSSSAIVMSVSMLLRKFLDVVDKIETSFSLVDGKDDDYGDCDTSRSSSLPSVEPERLDINCFPAARKRKEFEIDCNDEKGKHRRNGTGCSSISTATGSVILVTNEHDITASANATSAVAVESKRGKVEAVTNSSAKKKKQTKASIYQSENIRYLLDANKNLNDIIEKSKYRETSLQETVDKMRRQIELLQTTVKDLECDQDAPNIPASVQKEIKRSESHHLDHLLDNGSIDIDEYALMLIAQAQKS